MPSPFPCNPIIREWLWKKTQIKKKYQNCKWRTLFLYFFVCFKHFGQKISIINSHHLFLVSSHAFNSSVAFEVNFLISSFPFIPSKIPPKLSLLFLGGNVAIWVNKVSVVLNFTWLFSKFSRLLPNLEKGGKGFPVGCYRLEFLTLSLRP